MSFEISNCSLERLKNDFCLVFDEKSSSKDTVVYRSTMFAADEIKNFVQTVSEITNTGFVVYYENANPRRIVYQKCWICHHSDKKKSNNSQKNAACKAQINVLVKKVNRHTMRNDSFLKLKPPLPCVIKIDRMHSHHLETADSLRKLPVSKQVQMEFSEYFKDGLTPSEAKRLHESKLMMSESFDSTMLANSSINPKKHQCYYLHNKWRYLDKLKEKSNFYQKEDTSGTMSNIDIRGVKRGACRNCDCEEYIFKCSAGPPCYYCSCPPTKHVKLDQPTGIQQTEPDSTTSNLNQHSGVVSTNVTSVNRDEILKIQPTAPQLSNKLEDMSKCVKASFKYCLVPCCTSTTVNTPEKLFFCVPKDNVKRKAWTIAMKRDEKKNPALSTKTSHWCCEDHFSLEEDMENYWQWRLTNNVKRLKLKAGVVPHCFECQKKTVLSQTERKGALKRKQRALVREALSAAAIPSASMEPLTSKASATQVKRRTAKLKYLPPDQLKKNRSFTKQVKRGIAGLSSVSSNHVKETEYDSTLHDRNLELMNNEMQKTLPSKDTLKICLNGVRIIRQIRALNMSAAEHLKLYPALKYQDLLLWEFCSILQVAVADMEKRWSACLEALERYLDGSPNAVPQQCISNDMKTVHVLSVLPIMLLSGEETKGESKPVLELYPEDTKLSKLKEIVPEPSEPRLIGIGYSSQADLHLTCFVDKTPLFTELGVKALLMLLATYWVFAIKLTSEVRPSYLFLSAVILQKKFHSPHLSKSSSVTGLLKQLNLENK